MKRLIRTARNLWVIYKNWDILCICFQVMDDQKSKRSVLLTENLTLEEMGAVNDLASFYVYLSNSPKDNKKDFKNLRDSLTS